MAMTDTPPPKICLISSNITFIRFSVLCFVKENVSIGLVGNHPALGCWDPQLSRTLRPYRNASVHQDLKSTLWYADILIADLIQKADLTEKQCLKTEALCSAPSATRSPYPSTPRSNPCDVKKNFQSYHEIQLEYKFIQYPSSLTDPNTDPAPSLSSIHDTIINQSTQPETVVESIQQTLHQLSTHQKEIVPMLKMDSTDVHWEGQSSNQNRKLHLHIQVCDSNLKTEEARFDGFILSPQHFLESQSIHSLSEFMLTSRYYHTFRENQDIDFDQILPCLYMGTCPRKLNQLESLKKIQGVTCVFNFQTESDVLENPPIQLEAFNALSGSTVRDKLKFLYTSQLNLLYYWLPTSDMSTPARSAMISLAAHLLHCMIQAGHTVYVHCNAGVGRSAAAVCGYLCYVISLSKREANFFIQCRRPVCVWDEVAVDEGFDDYNRLFKRLNITSK